MFRTGLSGADLRLFHAALGDHRKIRVRVDRIPLDGTLPVMYPGETLQETVLDGQVDMAVDGEFSRTASVVFEDPRNRIQFGFDDMIRVWYGVRCDDLDDWVDVPVFTGPVRKLDWSESAATVEAHGKEVFHTEQAFQPFTLRKGMKKTAAIRELLERGGETHFDIPDRSARLPKSVSVAGSEDDKGYGKRLRRARQRARDKRTVGGQDTRWDKAQQIADSMNMQLFYDGRGVATLRARPDNTVYTFRDGTGGVVMSAPQVSRSIDRVRNCVRVKGGFPKALVQQVNAANSDDVDKNDMKLKESDRVRYSIIAPRSHPLSPWSLGLDEEPLYLPDFVDNEHIRSKGEAHALARHRLDEGLRAEADVTFDCLPVPHLEEADLVRVSTAAVTEVFRLRSFSLPLTHAGVMSVGYRKLVSNPSRRNVR